MGQDIPTRWSHWLPLHKPERLAIDCTRRQTIRQCIDEKFSNPISRHNRYLLTFAGGTQDR